METLDAHRSIGIISGIRNYRSIFAPLTMQKLLSLLACDGSYGTIEELTTATQLLVERRLIAFDARTDYVEITDASLLQIESNLS